MGFMFALTGIALLVPLFSYSSYVHTGRLSKRIENTEEVFINLTMAWFIAVCVPLAIIFQSKFLGYVVFAKVHNLLGFRMMYFPGCLIMGWKNDSAMLSSCFASFFLVSCYIGLRLSEVELYYLRPFSSSCIVLGGISYFMSLLILSTGYARNDKYLISNFFMLVTLTLGMYFGFVYQMDGLRNTSIVFSVFWLMEKYYELYFNVLQFE